MYMHASYLNKVSNYTDNSSISVQRFEPLYMYLSRFLFFDADLSENKCKYGSD